MVPGATAGKKASSTFTPWSAAVKFSISVFTAAGPKNEYYPNDEAYVFALADAMHEEYKAIVDAGFILQVDDPDLADGWQLNSHMNVSEYRKFAELRIDALNHA